MQVLKGLDSKKNNIKLSSRRKRWQGKRSFELEMICVCYKKVKVPKSYNCWEVVRDSYKCREGFYESYSCREAVRNSLTVGNHFVAVIIVGKHFATAVAIGKQLWQL